MDHFSKNENFKNLKFDLTKFPGKFEKNRNVNSYINNFFAIQIRSMSLLIFNSVYVLALNFNKIEPLGVVEHIFKSL